MHHNHSKTSPISLSQEIKKPYIKKPYVKQEGLKLFAVYPDYWHKKWGEPPLLGHVKETDEHWARYAAYDNRLLPYNSTFGPKVVQVDSPVRPVYKKKYGHGTSNKVRPPR